LVVWDVLLAALGLVLFAVTTLADFDFAVFAFVVTEATLANAGGLEAF